MKLSGAHEYVLRDTIDTKRRTLGTEPPRAPKGDFEPSLAAREMQQSQRI